MLEAIGIRHSYGAIRVLDIEKFAVPDGKVTALVGPNGCGKSTLLRILALIERPDAGTVSFNGETMSTARDRRAHRGSVTLVEQSPFLFNRSVGSNIRYALRLRGMPDASSRSRTAAALDRLGLAKLESTPASDLSIGQKQVVAVARGLALEPDVLLLDEPTSASDRSTSQLIHSALAEEAARGAAVLFTSHQLEQAFRASDSVSSMGDGSIVEATPENLFRCVVPEGDTAYRTVQVGSVELQIVTTRSGACTLAIPPEDIVLSKTRLESSARNQIEGRVVRISEHGTHGVSVVVDAGIDLTVRITRNSLVEFGITLGSELVLSVKATAIQVY